ncbi:MAG: metalloregulator ArsR/SmtB family transcription factor, partial [Alphaproteobacteria bacterium]|nr:metalloregulator ArsR/SmtB family transcription factor [Alphaproteobacteria bacterium]
MVVDILVALGEPTRLAVMRHLWEHGETCACELMPRLGVSQSRVSRHMQVLRQAGLVDSRRDAQRVLYRINPELPPRLSAVLDAVMAVEAGKDRS